jgi:hypothetical protein
VFGAEPGARELLGFADTGDGVFSSAPPDDPGLTDGLEDEGLAPYFEKEKKKKNGMESKIVSTRLSADDITTHTHPSFLALYACHLSQLQTRC